MIFKSRCLCQQWALLRCQAENRGSRQPSIAKPALKSRKALQMRLEKSRRKNHDPGGTGSNGKSHSKVFPEALILTDDCEDLNLQQDRYIPRASDTESDYEGLQSERRAHLSWPTSKTKILLPNSADDFKLQESGYYWDLAEEAKVLRPVNISNQEYHASLLMDWISQARHYEQVLQIFRDLRHLANVKATNLAFKRLLSLVRESKVPGRTVRQADGYPVLEKAVAKFFKETFPSVKAAVLSGVAELYGPCPWPARKDHIDEQNYFFSLLHAINWNQLVHWSIRDVSLICEAMAIMSARDVKVLTWMAEFIIKTGLQRASVGDISRIASAYSKLFFARSEENKQDLRRDLCKVIVSGVKAKLTSFDSKRLMATVGHLEQLSHHDPGLFKAVTQDLESSGTVFTAQELVVFLIACCRRTAAREWWEHDTEVMFQAVKAVDKRLNDIALNSPKQFSAPVLANAVFALSTLRFHSDQLLERIAILTTDKVTTMPSQDILNIAIGFARLGFSPGQHFLDSLNQHIMTNKAYFVGGPAAAMLWAFALFQATDQPAFEILLETLHGSTVETFNPVYRAQLFTAVTCACMDRHHWGRARVERSIGKSTLEKIEGFQKALAQQYRQSKLQREVGQLLNVLDVAHREEYIPEHGLFSVDIAFSRETDGHQQQIALEVDGPSHYSWNNNQPLGSTLNNTRMLESYGWEVWRIPYYEYSIHKTKLDKIKYLAGLLTDIGIFLDPHRYEEAIQAATLEAERLNAQTAKVTVDSSL